MLEVPKDIPQIVVVFYLSSRCDVFVLLAGSVIQLCEFFSKLCVGLRQRMFADCCALLGDISTMVLGDETWGENLNTCIKTCRCLGEAWRLFAHVADHLPD